MRKSLGAIFLAAGIVLCGYFLYLGISKFAEKDRCVTVKGLSEREVLANSVVWPIEISLCGNDEEVLRSHLNAQADSVIAFLKENKMNEDDISVSDIDYTDRWDYESGRQKYDLRYEASLSVRVCSHDVPKVLRMKKMQKTLRAKGVVAELNSSNTEYEYVDLSSLKPEMVEEATKDARKVAEKFAEDADCKLGSIVNATQGSFTIEDIYYKPQYKKIRVVTTIAYYLK